MHIKDIDLNLLRLFDAVYRTRKVGQAAELLDLTQPAASQGLTRLRLLMKDPLFVRAGGGVQPPRRPAGRGRAQRAGHAGASAQ